MKLLQQLPRKCPFHVFLHDEVQFHGKIVQDANMKIQTQLQRGWKLEFLLILLSPYRKMVILP